MKRKKKYKKRNNLCSKKGWWYYRLCWGTGANQREKPIPLKTKQKDVANKLGKYINGWVDDFRNGIYQENQIKELCWWLNDEGTSEVKEYTLESVTPKYLDYKKSNSQCIRWD